MKKVYKIRTYADDIEYEITGDQYQQLKLKLNELKFVNIGDNSLAVSNIKEIFCDHETSHEREEEGKSDISALLGAPVMAYLTSGIVDLTSLPREEAYRKRKLYAKVWFDHVQRRPALNAEMGPKRQKAWEIRQAALPKGDPERFKFPSGLLGFDYAPWEMFKTSWEDYWMKVVNDEGWQAEFAGDQLRVQK